MGWGWAGVVVVGEAVVVGGLGAVVVERAVVLGEVTLAVAGRFELLLQAASTARASSTAVRRQRLLGCVCTTARPPLGSGQSFPALTRSKRNVLLLPVISVSLDRVAVRSAVGQGEA